MELYTKDNDGKMQKLGDAQSIPVRLENLKSEVNKYWTDKKSGKHEGLAAKHEAILSKDLIVSPADFFEQVNKNHFIFQEFGPYSLKDFLKKARLDQYVKPEYLDDCLAVNTPQPAVGRGEFLLAANFANINFNEGSGDLVDDKGSRIEVKGKSANLGGSNEMFKPMNGSVLFDIYGLFGTGTKEKNFTLEMIDEIQGFLLKNKSKMMPLMMILQNRRKPSRILAKAMCELFNNVQDLKLVIASAHLRNYMKLQNANYLFALNDNVFRGFKAPKNIKEAFEIVKHFNVTGWVTGNKGISISLKNGNK